MILRCPVCHTKLIKNQQQYQCDNDHRFDISKEGYLNLLLKQGRKEYGDTSEMIKARREFLNKGYYQLLSDRLIDLIKEVNVKIVLDSGCGEGYYTDLIKKAIVNLDIIGVDIAKKAIKIAQKTNKDILYIVAHNQDLPIVSDSVDLVLNCFAPYDLNEYLRVLKKEGILIMITPAKEHLLQLKEVLYESVYLNEEKDELNGFKLMNKEVIEYEIKLDDHKDIMALFMMTPYYHRTPQAGKIKLAALDQLKTKISFMINIYCVD